MLPPYRPPLLSSQKHTSLWNQKSNPSLLALQGAWWPRAFVHPNRSVQWPRPRESYGPRVGGIFRWTDPTPSAIFQQKKYKTKKRGQVLRKKHFMNLYIPSSTIPSSTIHRLSSSSCCTQELFEFAAQPRCRLAHVTIVATWVLSSLHCSPLKGEGF